MATATAALAAGGAMAQSDEEVKIGIILGFTGPIESITPAMGASAELALSEINESGNFLDGQTLTPVQADSTCVDSAAATAAAERLVTTDGIVAIVGADCSGVTGAILSNVAVPNGVPMISPSATSPGLSTAEDDDLFFRTAPSDARQGEVLAGILESEGINSVAVTYTNNDYGKGLADSFVASFEEAGGEVTLTSPHEDNKADYSAEIGALASAGGDVLVVLGYADSGGKGMIQAAADTGAFSTFMLGDGMYGQEMLDDLSDVARRLLRRRAVVPGRRRRGVRDPHERHRRFRPRQLLHPRELRRGRAARARDAGGRRSDLRGRGRPTS